MHIVPLDRDIEGQFLRFLNQDRINHFYAIYNLRYLRESTLVWVALRDRTILGYLLEYTPRKILSIRGDASCVAVLLGATSLTEPEFNIELSHLSVVDKLYEPIDPSDPTTVGKISTFLTMKIDKETFNPIIKHRVKRLGIDDLDAASECLNMDRNQIEEMMQRGAAFGIYKKRKMVSLAASPEILKDLAIIRGVQTVPSFRNRGYATSACSALVSDLINQNKKVMLYVSKDNQAAIRAYEKIGFKKTYHVYLSFKSKKRHK